MRARALRDQSLIEILLENLKIVQSQLVTSHSLFCRIRTPYVTYEAIENPSIRTTYKRFNRKIEGLRSWAGALIALIDSPSPSFYTQLLVALIGRVGECGEAAILMIYQLAAYATRFNFSVILSSINFDPKPGMRSYSHAVLVICPGGTIDLDFFASLQEASGRCCNDFFNRLPTGAIVVDPFLQVMFSVDEAILSEGQELTDSTSPLEHFYTYMAAYGASPFKGAKVFASQCYPARSLAKLIAPDQRLEVLQNELPATISRLADTTSAITTDKWNAVTEESDILSGVVSGDGACCSQQQQQQQQQQFHSHEGPYDVSCFLYWSCHLTEISALLKTITAEEGGILVKVLASFLRQSTPYVASLTCCSIWGWKGPGPWRDAYVWSTNSGNLTNEAVNEVKSAVG